MVMLVATPALRVQNGAYQGREFELGTSLRIGRHPYNEASIPDLSASRYHCWVQGTDTGYFIEDLASTNGTFVNGARIRGRQLLKPGDSIRVGMTQFHFREEE